MKKSLRFKFAFMFICTFVLSLFMFITSTYTYQVLIQRIQDYSTSLSELNEFSAEFDEFNEYLESYLQTGSTEDLNSCQESNKTVNEICANVTDKYISSGNDIQSNLASAISTYYSAYIEQVQTLIDMDNRTQATGRYENQYSKNSEYISGYIEKLISYNYNMSSSVLEDASTKVGIFKIVNVASFIVLFIIMGILFRMTFHNVIAPIQKLAKQSQQIANYNFDVQDISVSTNDEMSELVKMFNHMREKLKLMFDSNIKNLQMAEELLVQIQGDENLAELVQSQKHLNEEMFKEANIDHLTHLMNQNAFIHCVNENIKSISRNDLCALFVIDVDNFTSINATLGEGAEEVLKYSAGELNNLFKDCGFIARWDKDVFVGYISGLPNVEFVHQKCKDINAIMNIHFRHKKKYYPVTASIGVYLCTSPISAEVMFERAEKELQTVKDAGKNGYHINNY